MGAAMIQSFELRYFFDPFCGWCYASAPALQGLANRFPAKLRMMPSGLFFGERPVSTIADHAYRNDQRIQSLTAQVFSEDYHQKVMRAPGGIFSSAAATLALQVLGELDSKLEPAFLHAVQIARYVEARDTSKEGEVAEVAAAIAAQHGFELNVGDFIDIMRNDASLRQRTHVRMEATQTHMAQLGISGVPQLIAIIDNKATGLNGEILYGGPERVIAALENLTVAA